MSVAIENPAPCSSKNSIFFLFHQKTLLVNYFQKPWQYLKSSSGDPFLRKIGKFKIGLNLEIMQIEAFSKRSYEKTKGSLYFIFTSFDTHFSKLLSSYILSRFRIFFYFLHPFKESNVSSFVDTVNFTIFQRVIASRVYLYIYLAVVKIVFWKNHAFLLYVIPKLSALDENVSSAL